VNTLEFAKEVVAVLSDADLSNVIKKAASNGFVVQGFKSPWKAPRSQIIGPGISKKKRGGDYYYITLLKAVVDSEIIIDNGTELSELVKNWVQDDKTHDEISDKLEQIKLQKFKNGEKEKGLDTDKNETEIINSEVKVKEKNIELQEKNKKLRQINQSNKIALDNSQQKIQQLQKENEKLKKDTERLTAENEECINKLNDLKEQIIVKDKKIQELVSQIGDLEKYKQRAPKILCLCKRKLDYIYFEGYDIAFENSWDEEVKDKILTQNFSEIWFISKGFSYNVFLEIQDLVKCSVKKYLNIDKMLSEIGG
jgi:hypothetical protein